MDNAANYTRVKTSMEFIAANFKNQPGIPEIAGHVNLSESHFERIFKEWAGISPKKFLQYVTLNELKKNIMTADNLIELSETVGLSSQSRVYDLFVNIESVTPREYKTKGKGMDVQYGIHDTPFGRCFIANTTRGICALEFIDINDSLILEHFRLKWQHATITENARETRHLIDVVFHAKSGSLSTLLYGTPFQIKVWEALIRIPCGKITSYSSIAELIGHPNAGRAVGGAIGSNNIAILIPCHRVVQNLGGLGGYKWGAERKLAIIGYERSRSGEGNIDG